MNGANNLGSTRRTPKSKDLPKEPPSIRRAELLGVVRLVLKTPHHAPFVAAMRKIPGCTFYSETQSWYCGIANREHLIDLVLQHWPELHEKETGTVIRRSDRNG